MLIGDQPERAHRAVLDVYVLAHRELNVRLRLDVKFSEALSVGIDHARITASRH
jgi:hypothetical protein